MWTSRPIGTERREATLFDLPSSRFGQHVYVQAALLISHRSRIFLSLLNFENIVLLFPVALGCLSIFSAEKLTTASWKAHLSGGGSKRTAPFLFILTFYHPTSLQPRKPRVVRWYSWWYWLDNWCYHILHNKSNSIFATSSDNFRQQSIRKNLHMK